MKQIKTQDAVGHVLCHDITQIIRGAVKEAVFRKGHIVTEADIPVLLSMGKDNLFIWEAREGMLHENDAAKILYDIAAGEHMRPTEVKEGKIEIAAECDGVFLVDTQKLRAINSLGEIVIATRISGFPVRTGDKLAGARIIPLVISEEKMAEAQALGDEVPLLTLRPFISKKVAVISTGNEIYYQRTNDAFMPLVEEKLAEYSAVITEKLILPDSPEEISSGILSMIKNGAEMVICTGGMSVDPDDCTPQAIRDTGADIVNYGAPVLPGAMLMLSYYKGRIPILGLPGCVMYGKRTIFDVLLPKLMADIRVTADELAALGHGGLCLNCENCVYPTCTFGKGSI